MPGKFIDAIVADQAKVVDMGQTKYWDLTKGIQVFGTDGVRGCSILIITSTTAHGTHAILCHISPLRPLALFQKEISDLYTEHHEKFKYNIVTFMVTANVLAGMPGDSRPSSSQVNTQSSQLAANIRNDEITDMLTTRLGFPHPMRASLSMHLESEGDSPEFPDKGTVFLDARPGQRIPGTYVYCENRVVTILNHED